MAQFKLADNFADVFRIVSEHFRTTMYTFPIEMCREGDVYSGLIISDQPCNADVYWRNKPWHEIPRICFVHSDKNGEFVLDFPEDPDLCVLSGEGIGHFCKMFYEAVRLDAHRKQEVPAA